MDRETDGYHQNKFYKDNCRGRSSLQAPYHSDDRLTAPPAGLHLDGYSGRSAPRKGGIFGGRDSYTPQETFAPISADFDRADAPFAWSHDPRPKRVRFDFLESGDRPPVSNSSGQREMGSNSAGKRARLDPRTDPRTYPRTDPRHDLHPNPRSDRRPDRRSDPRHDLRPNPRPNPRPDPRHDPRPDPHIDPRSDPRSDRRSDRRRASPPDPRPASPIDPRPASRPDRRPKAPSKHSELGDEWPGERVERQRVWQTDESSRHLRLIRSKKSSPPAPPPRPPQPSTPPPPQPSPPQPPPRPASPPHPASPPPRPPSPPPSRLQFEEITPSPEQRPTSEALAAKELEIARVKLELSQLQLERLNQELDDAKMMNRANITDLRSSIRWELITEQYLTIDEINLRSEIREEERDRIYRLLQYEYAKFDEEESDGAGAAGSRGGETEGRGWGESGDDEENEENDKSDGGGFFSTGIEVS